MTDSSPITVLVGVDLSDPPFLPQPLMRKLSELDILLLGWEEVPDQTSTDQAQQQFEEEAEGALKSVASSFEEEGAEVRSRLVFTSDRFEAIERAAAEEKCDAILIPRPSMEIGRVLLSLRGLSNADRIAQVTARLIEDETTVQLLHAAEGSEEPEEVEETLLKEATELLALEGIDEGKVERRSVSGLSPAEAVNQSAGRGDLVVIGESETSLGNRLFSSRSEKIARETPAPVLIVKYVYDERRTDPATRASGEQA